MNQNGQPGAEGEDLPVAHEVLAQAVDLQNAGDLERAATLVERLLDQDQSNAAALNRLGLIEKQQGRFPRAVALFGRAVAVRPNVPAFHANLAEAYRVKGDLLRASGACRAALLLWPDYVDGLNTYGLVLLDQGAHAEAAEQFRRALEQKPDLAFLHNNLGIALRDEGKVDQALTAFRRAVELAPAFARARTNLGQLLLVQGQVEEALEHFHEAARLQPDAGSAHHNVGIAQARLGRQAEAREAFLEALRLAPDSPETYSQIGLTLQREGRLGEAVPWFEQAVKLAPSERTFHEQLAGLHTEREAWPEAIAAWEQVIALAPEKRAAPHLALGWALQEEGRLEEARAHYLNALDIEPGSPWPHLNLGGVHEELGELAEAERSFRAALGSQPEAPVPLARLATLLREKIPDRDLKSLEDRLADPALERGARARLLFALAHVLDARGDFARAAESLREANALQLEVRHGRHDYSAEQHDRFVDDCRQVFHRDFFAEMAHAGSETRGPVFIIGLPRSGTTLVEQVLASHPQVVGAGELRLARQTFESIPALLESPDPPVACVPLLSPSTLCRLIDAHLEKLDALRGGRAERIVDKMPDNYLFLGLLAAMFPNALFIHCQRDLRDVAVSCWMTDFRSIRWANDPGEIAARFRAYVQLMDHWRSVLPAPIVEVAYEETVADLEGVARRLVAACGLEWDPACLAFHSTRRVVRTASIVQVRQPIYTRSVGRWKHYEGALADLFARLSAGAGPPA